MANPRPVVITYKFRREHLVTRATTVEKALAAAHRRVASKEFSSAYIYNEDSILVGSVERLQGANSRGLYVSTKVFK